MVESMNTNIVDRKRSFGLTLEDCNAIMFDRVFEVLSYIFVYVTRRKPCGFAVAI